MTPLPHGWHAVCAALRSETRDEPGHRLPLIVLGGRLRDMGFILTFPQLRACLERAGYRTSARYIFDLNIRPNR
ncbi:hypothetical protein [Streptomyces shenzhenensis]|uniref:hypothetical protein n=1 Tax=Streptomyces shenzhenensis TaxID=943815 RepID=UPI0036A6CB35